MDKHTGLSGRCFALASISDVICRWSCIKINFRQAVKVFVIITTIGYNIVRAVDEKEAGTPTKSLLRRSGVSEIEFTKIHHTLFRIILN